MIIGLIPARGGSKGVPRKNVREIEGNPLIAYAIECAKKCPSIDHVVVSTDDDEISRVAEKFGAEVPFLRPSELARDTAAMLPVLRHAVEFLEDHYKKRIDLVVLLDPTGPLRTVEDVEGAIEMHKESKCEMVISGNVARKNPYFNMVKEKDNGFVELVCSSEESIVCRQDAPKVYDLNTVVWVYSRKAVMEDNARLSKETMLYQIPAARTIDVDSEEDIELLEEYLRKNRR